MTHSSQCNPRRREELETVEVDGELVIWDPTVNRVHRLDRIATLIWPHLDGTVTLGELADDLAEVFDQPRSATLGSLLTLVRELEDADLIAGDNGGIRTAADNPADRSDREGLSDAGPC